MNVLDAVLKIRNGGDVVAVITETFRAFTVSPITIQDIEALERYHDTEVKRNANILTDFYNDDESPSHKKSTEFVIGLFNNAVSKINAYLQKERIPYVDRKNIVVRLLDGDFPSKVDDIFPIPIYVSSTPSDKMTIGLLLHSNGKVTEFEGSDEATEQTHSLVDRLLNIGKEKVLVWGMHTADVVVKIKATSIIPAGLYVSPDRQHAASYWDIKGDRILFNGIIPKINVFRESEVDWKIKPNTKIEKLRIF